jgi:hypothetical protein
MKRGGGAMCDDARVTLRRMTSFGARQPASSCGEIQCHVLFTQRVPG